MKLKKNLVFGLGPGRCGSSSLAWLLNEQEGALVSHELFPILPWDTTNNAAIQYRWEQLHHQSMIWNTVGDVGSYYVQWVPFLMNSFAAIPHLRDGFSFKFIVLERPIEEIVTSYLAKFKKNNNNPLQDHEDPNLVTNEWDASYPKYNGVSQEEAIRMYCTDYYNRCRTLQAEYPENVKIFNVDDLNTEQGVENILRFAGFEKPNILTAIKRNSS